MASYTDETRAAVMAALLAGQSLNQVAREYNIPKATVSRWKKLARSIKWNTKKEIGALLEDYLSANLETLRVQLKVFQDETFLKRGGVSEAAVLHGVLTDKAIRLLEAIAKSQSNEVE